MYNVLIVDDDTLMRNALRAMISRFKNFQIIGEAANGAEAIAICRLYPVHLIFMDIIMYMAIAVVSLIVHLGISLYIPHWGFMIILIWPAIAMITLGIRRLHDSLLSGLWMIGLFIPYINIFVSYHLLFKKSWHIDN